MRRSLYALAILAALVAHSAIAASYDEAVNGDLSGIPETPTALTLSLGANIITGSAGMKPSPIDPEDRELDADLLSFTVPAGMQLNTIMMLSYANSSSAFFGLQAGTPWNDVVGSNLQGVNLLSYTLIDPGFPSVDLLADFYDVIGPSAPFSIPLPAGVYTFETQDIDTQYTYSLSFNVTATGSLIPGDFDGQGKVAAADLARWRRDFNVTYHSSADGDADSDGNDFLIWQRNLGQGTPAATAAGVVPEPASAALAALALPWLLRRRRTV